MTKVIKKYYALLGLALLLSISGILLFSFRSYNKAVQSQVAQFNDQQLLVAHQTVHSLEEAVKLLVREIEILSKMPFIIDLDIEKAEVAMEQTFNYIKEFSIVDMAILDSNGIVRLPLIAKELKGFDFSYREYFTNARRVKEKIPTYEFITFKGVDKGKKGIVIAMPIFNAHRNFGGVIVAILKVDEFIRNFMPLKNNIAFFVMETDGNILYHPLHDSGTNMKALPNMPPSYAAFLEKISTGRQQTAEYISPLGIKTLAAASPASLAGQRWIVISTTPKETVKKLLVDFTIEYILSTAGIVLIIILVAMLIVYLINRLNISLQDEILSRRRAEQEKEKVIVELKDAISKIKILSGLIPICASCKKIRDDKGYWNQIEVYISEHSEAEFTHGLCSDCTKKIYPEFYKE
jgi:hypothetical protein